MEEAAVTSLSNLVRLMTTRNCTFSSEGIIYSVDELTGGLIISHRLVLPARDYPGCPGPVSCLRWTPDGTALALAWQRGGFSIWSTFGAMIMCSLCWDYGPTVSDPVGQNPLCIKSLVRFRSSWLKWQLHQTLLFIFSFELLESIRLFFMQQEVKKILI